MRTIKLVNWIATNDRIKEQVNLNFTGIIYPLKLYNRVHQGHHLHLGIEQQFSDFYKVSVRLKQAEMIYVGAAAITVELVASRLLWTILNKGMHSMQELFFWQGGLR